QRRELVAEERRADEVHGREHVRTGAKVAAKRDLLDACVGPRLPAPLPEDLEIRMTESVDRLELVADAEQSRLRTAQRVHESELDRVRVLELVHHDVGESRPPRIPHRAVAAKQLERPKLEVLEVGGRSLRLQPLVLSIEARKQRSECGETLRGEL